MSFPFPKPVRHGSAAFLLGLLLISTGCSKQDDRSTTLPTYVVAKGTIERTIDELGVVESPAISKIVAPFGGKLISVIDSATEVKKGDIVAKMDTRDVDDKLLEKSDELREAKKRLEGSIETLTIALRSNALDISAAQAELDLARVQLEDVNKNLSELDYLESRAIVARDQVRDAAYKVGSTQTTTRAEDYDLRGKTTSSLSDEKSKRVDIERYGMQGEHALTRVKEKQEQLAQSDLRAPKDGMFLRAKSWSWQLRREVEKQPGQELDEGEEIGRIPDLTNLVIRSQVAEAHMMTVRPGLEVALVFDALGKLTLPGKVHFVSPMATERETSPGGRMMARGQTLTGEKVFEIEVELLKQDPRLKPGLTARTIVTLDKHENVLTIPLSSIVTRSGEHFARIPGVKGSVELKPVKLGTEDGKMVEVLSGLSSGDVVLK